MDKQAVREAVWDAFDEGDQARFPFPPHDRIPNFAGADAAAARLAETEAWESAETLKANPDAPQLPVRRAALRAGKTVYVAQPRLRDPDPFLRLDPAEIPAEEIDDATTVSGISEYGTPTAPKDVDRVDLIVAGSVGVTTDGARIGKGEGYSDLEWAVLRELDAVDSEAQRASDSRTQSGDSNTTLATTVHELSVLDGPESAVGADVDLPEPDAHDVPLDLVVTPERTIETETPYARPDGLDWDALDAEKLSEIPVLAERAPETE
ncbi:5-formyltetrahydrofolate cyclo-ligase [Halorubrum californiense DSM 19288]|uniref:5-formyltetrahydrofolate cyclo-ligase n=1 Tax=Halorubrum californiense DSM 19288 TaxID=1227465 RepID=M0EBH4_9EURY|nr:MULTISPECIES: 5-formyltetrahydrofolate cyclo-ligase [Halorubrum]ELZ45105.1 5-formyltetrahydrofolate cyclo-ligase [Halorubrum californiense DSM 19288]TKX68911.1 5-formyltetrahydrofolate cyclo-ligase [Halorubrum sp. GN11GM_10-3_MGM]